MLNLSDQEIEGIAAKAAASEVIDKEKSQQLQDGRLSPHAVSTPPDEV